MQILTSEARTRHWQQIKQAFYQDKLLYGYVLFTTIALYLMSLMFSYASHIEYSAFTYLSTLIRICYITFLTWSSAYYLYLLYHRRPHPIQAYIKTLIGFFNPLSKAISFILLVFALNLTYSCYSYLKSVIPDIKPFQYDLAFYELDKWLHFGVSPWEITHGIFSSPFATYGINFLYHLWFLLMWGMTLFFIVRRDLTHLRNQYLIAYMSSWLLIGGITATLLSSAGPCYTHLLNPEHTHYLPLIDLLNDQSRIMVEAGWFPVWALDVQDSLWLNYLGREGGIGAGISAMPSMHVSVAMLMALASYQYNKKLGLLMWAYMIFIQIGSVHLAWHYAIDGYLSIILTLLIWKGCGWISHRLTSEPSQ